MSKLYTGGGLACYVLVKGGRPSEVLQWEWRPRLTGASTGQYAARMAPTRLVLRPALHRRRAPAVAGKRGRAHKHMEPPAD